MITRNTIEDRQITSKLLHSATDQNLTQRTMYCVLFGHHNSARTCLFAVSLLRREHFQQWHLRLQNTESSYFPDSVVYVTKGKIGQ